MGIPAPTTILKFVLAAAVGIGATLGIAAATQSGPKSTAVAGPETLYQAAASDAPVAFTTQAAGGTLIPLQAPPATQGIQLSSYTSNPAPPATSTARPPWINQTSYPRVPPLSQFDGGPLQAYNCTMTSGAMLVRLGYGVVTTGSQLRALQPKQGPVGTNLDDVNTAVGSGWGVHFAKGLLTPLQFRALIYAGAGAILQGVYGVLPVSERLQASFTGGHAIYIDGFRPPQGGSDSAYYVIDPIGHPWAGYRGQWLPASDIEAFAEALGGGSMITAWAFPGGLTPPAHYQQLPPDAFPHSGPPPSAGPSASAGASASPSASSSPAASTPPSPPPLPSPQSSGVPNPPSGTITPVIPADVSILDQLTATVGGSLVIPAIGLCVSPPIPASCPAGLPAVYPSGASPGPVPTPPSPVHLMYASAPQPGLVQIIFSGPGDASSLDFWKSDGSGPVRPADVQPATLGGKAVWVATFPVAQGRYGFTAGVLGSGIAGQSQIGAITVGP